MAKVLTVSGNKSVQIELSKADVMLLKNALIHVGGKDEVSVNLMRFFNTLDDLLAYDMFVTKNDNPDVLKTF